MRSEGDTVNSDDPRIDQLVAPGSSSVGPSATEPSLSNRSRRAKYFISHLGVSAGIVGLVSLLVLLVWYPRPLFRLDGALTILALLAAVDVVVGPVITLIIASPRKTGRELMRDISIIGIVQLAALMYGAHALFVARPAFVVFNANRFDSVGANELARPDKLPYRDERFKHAPVLGPQWTLARPADSEELRTEMLFSAADGGPDLKHHPALYETWPQAGGVDRNKILPLDRLLKNSTETKLVAQEAMRVSKLDQGQLGYVPLVGRERSGVVILNLLTLEIVLTTDAEPPL